VLGAAVPATGRGSPTFTVIGYSLIIGAGVVMLIQSLRPASADHDGGHILAAGIGLLPCPLTISVLGFTWVQATAAMVGLVLFSLALGIATTIGMVAIFAIIGRSVIGTAVTDRLPQIDRAARLIQGMAAVAIIAIGIFTLTALRA
jgi:ABC-type nickel/cobalt efflux system permease component RcnA